MEKQHPSLPRHCFRSGKGRPTRGFSLLELTIAILLSGLVISMVFYAWKYVSIHTIKQQQKTIFQSEADLIVQIIERDLRKSAGVVKLSSNRVVFLLPGGIDTVSYKLENGQFSKNDTVIWHDDNRARLCQFDIAVEAPPVGADSAAPINLSLTIGFTDRFGHSAVYPLKMRTDGPPGGFGALSGRQGGWNF